MIFIKNFATIKATYLQRGITLKKLVIKTAIITLASIIALMGLLYGVFALFIPKPLGDLFYKSGNYTAGMYYYEKQYNATKSTEDLWTLCLNVDVYGDSVRAEKYLTEFKSNPKFESNCAKLDEGNTDAMTTEEFIEGKLVCAIYINHGIDQAVSTAYDCVKAFDLVGGEYTTYNPFFMLYSDPNFLLGVPELTKIRVQIEYMISRPEQSPEGEYESTMLNQDEMEIAVKDVYNIMQLLGN